MTEPVNHASIYKFDIVLFGGGIAGLWLLNHLCSKGFNAILIEASALGNGQSIASQGIIHGGLKYALSGSLTSAANAIAGMPARWRDCLQGRDDVDLSGCNLLSEHYYMWSNGGLRSRLKSFLGSKTLRGKIDALDTDKYPAFFSNNTNDGSLYQLSDFVVDTTSLISTLSSLHRNRIFKVSPQKLQIHQGENTASATVSITADSGAITIEAQRLLFCAGEGNRDLLQQSGLSSPQMQVRPLNMVIVRKPGLPLVYVHCVGDNFSLTPVLTLTSHVCVNGEVAWYLGGEIAESGVGKNNSQQVQAAKELLLKLFPQVDLTDGKWECLEINRAEGKASGQHRPDSVFLQIQSNIMVAWPTKFTLSPALADEVSAALTTQGISPLHSSDSAGLAKLLPFPSIAKPPWESLFGSA